MKYIYTAVFTFDAEDNTVYARVPDLPGCITTGTDIADAIAQITDAASGWLVVAEDEGDPIPAATPQNLIVHEPDAQCSLIQIDTFSYRALTDSRAVRKNVSLPAWMATLSDRYGLNCSQLLQEAISARLNAM